jgi:hypothetical protein
MYVFNLLIRFIIINIKVRINYNQSLEIENKFLKYFS